MSASASSREIYCGFEKGPLLVIDAHGGTTLDKLRKVLRIFSSRWCDCELVQEKGKYRTTGRHVLDIPAASFAILDAALSPDAVCISESNYGIRCIELASGKQSWHHRSLGSNHVSYCSSDRNFYCVALVETPARSCSLIRLAPNLLDCDRIAVLGPYCEAVFFESGNALVTARGEIYETTTGRLLNRLSFPQCEYPDSPP